MRFCLLCIPLLISDFTRMDNLLTKFMIINMAFNLLIFKKSLYQKQLQIFTIFIALNLVSIICCGKFEFIQYNFKMLLFSYMAFILVYLKKYDYIQLYFINSKTFTISLAIISIMFVKFRLAYFFAENYSIDFIHGE